MVKVSIDSKDLEKRLKNLTKQVNIAADESIISMAQIGAAQLAFRTTPYGTNKKSQDVAEKAIYKDISKVYQNIGVTYNLIKKIDPKKAISYAYCMNNGQESNAEKIAESVLGTSFDVGNVDSGQLLDNNRNSKGRVTKATNPRGIKNTSEIEALKAKKKLRAGLAKSGWIQAGIAILSKTRVAAWLKNKSGGLGEGKILRAGWKTTVTLTNHVKYASDVISSSQIRAAIKNAYMNQIKKLQKQIDHIAKSK